MKKDLSKISKFLSYILRHHPEAIGISLDEQGWTDIQTLIEKANKKKYQLDLDLIHLVVDTNDKKRFTISENGLKIRAAQGHSTNDVKICYIERKPPEILYHGTSLNYLKSIKEKGLLSKTRQYVHLSEDIQTAKIVGSRHGQPIVFSIDAKTMNIKGYKFYQAENGVWLAEKIPPDYLSSTVINSTEVAITSKQPKLSK